MRKHRSRPRSFALPEPDVRPSRPVDAEVAAEIEGFFPREFASSDAAPPVDDPPDDEPPFPAA